MKNQLVGAFFGYDWHQILYNAGIRLAASSVKISLVNQHFLTKKVSWE